MPISGLVVTLSETEESAQRAVNVLTADPRLRVGVRSGRRLAVVSETHSRSEDQALWAALRADPGVTHVDVAFIHLDEEPAGGDDQTVAADSRKDRAS